MTTLEEYNISIPKVVRLSYNKVKALGLDDINFNPKSGSIKFVLDIGMRDFLKIFQSQKWFD